MTEVFVFLLVDENLIESVKGGNENQYSTCMLIRANAYKSFMLIRAFFLAPFFSLSKSLWDIRALPYGYKSLLCRSLIDFWNRC